MKDIAVMSGKGGTGKTSIAAALGVVVGTRAVMADCDVDAANLHLLYEPHHVEEHEFWSGKKAVIDYDLCTDCGVCLEQCRFDAIDAVEGEAAKGTRYVIDTLACEGCAVCHHMCPVGAIEMEAVMAGEWFVSRSRFGHRFVHASLGIGQENSGKLVSRVKEEARQLANRENIPFVIVDGPPGIGCPVIAALSGVDHVLIVTEATQSGMSDMERLVALARHFNIPVSCVINKCDLSEDVASAIDRFCGAQGIDVINTIPFTPVFVEALQDGRTLMEMGDEMIKDKIIEIWDHLERTVQPR